MQVSGVAIEIYKTKKNKEKNKTKKESEVMELSSSLHTS